MIEKNWSKTQKTKVINLYEETPKQLLNPIPAKNCPLGHQKVKNDPKIKSKSNVGIEGNKENKDYCTICT